MIFADDNGQKAQPIRKRIRDKHEEKSHQGFDEVNFFPLNRQGIKRVHAPLVHFEGVHEDRSDAAENTNLYHDRFKGAGY